MAIRSKNGRQRLQLTSLSISIEGVDISTRVVWKPRRNAVQRTLAKPRTTSVFPLGLDQIILGYSEFSSTDVMPSR